MRIVFFGNETEKIAAIRYRIITFARMLEADGHHCTICLPASVSLRDRLFENRGRGRKLLYLFLVLLRRLGQLRHVPGADVVYFRGPLFPYGPPVFERFIRCLNPRLIFDIDDAIWEPPAHVDSVFLRCMDFGWVRKMAGLCRHAVVGNRHLAEYVKRYNPSITIIPTCIDITKHNSKQIITDTNKVTLGWVGLKDNLGYLEPIEPVIRRLASKHALQLSIATGRDYHLDGVEVVNHPWTLDEEIAYLHEADIGLMPLKDTPRARGKCAFKALQYMAVGVPCVVSPVGMNTEVIDDGVNGFLADSPEEWETKLDRLISDGALRRRMGAAARDTVLARYTHAVYYPVLQAALAAVAPPLSSRTNS